MTLSAQDADDTRRYCGYPVTAAISFMDPEMQGYSLMLDMILASLTVGQVTSLQTTYLAPLRILEAAIPTAGDNLDTDRAAVWYHNKQEVADRENLYQITRQKLCFFLGIPAGAGVAPLAPAVFTV